MSKTQPTYTKEIKRQAVNLFETSGKSKTQIARDGCMKKLTLLANGLKSKSGKAGDARLKRRISHTPRASISYGEVINCEAGGIMPSERQQIFPSFTQNC